MLRYEDFPKKCLKCKRSDLPLEKFKIGYVKVLRTQGRSFSGFHKSEYKSYSVKFPVCRKCKIQFSRHLFAKKMFYIMILVDLFPLLLTLLFTFVSPPIKFPFNILPFTISFIITIIFAALIRIFPHKVKNYIEATENGVVIKDPDYEKEFQTFIMSRMVEDEFDINKIPCPKCGSLMMKDADFCLSCGKDLRNY